MVNYIRKFGITVLCYDEGELLHKEHFIATDPDMVKKLALDYVYDVQDYFDDFRILDRSVMTSKEQFAH